MQDRIEIFRRVERQYLRDRLGPLGLQPLDGMVLGLADREGPIRQEDLAVQMALDKGAVARSVARLEALGLVARAVSPRCRREKLVSLTPAGEAACRAIGGVMEEWNRVCYRGFTPEERARYDGFLTRIVENVMRFRREEQDG